MTIEKLNTENGEETVARIAPYWIFHKMYADSAVPTKAPP
jgi:hypothetical protein